jgi:hypothetical protein
MKILLDKKPANTHKISNSVYRIITTSNISVKKNVNEMLIVNTNSCMSFFDEADYISNKKRSIIVCNTAGLNDLPTCISISIT